MMMTPDLFQLFQSMISDLNKIKAVVNDLDTAEAQDDVAAAIDDAMEQTTPEDTNAIPLTDTGVLKWISWANIKVALNLLYGRLAAVNAWTRQQFIDGSADEVQQRVQGHSSQTANLATWESSGGAVDSWIDASRRYRGTAGMYVKNALLFLLGEDTADSGMTGMYDRNEIMHAARRGVVTVTITGAGSYTNTVPEKDKMFDASGGTYIAISGTDATTTQIRIHLDMLALQPNYFSAFWQPYVQYRLAMNGGVGGTYYRNIVVEVSPDNTNWYKPSGGLWETTDAGAVELVAGYWLGSTGNPAIGGSQQWRYVRFTLTDRVENPAYASKDFVWIAELGLRHRAGVWARQYPTVAGAEMRGDATWTDDGVAASSYNTKIAQNGSAVFNEQGADVDFRVEGDTDPNLLVADASADGVAIGVAAAQAKLHVMQLTGGNEVLRVESTTSGDDPRWSVFQNRVATTDATVTTLHTFTIGASNNVLIEAIVTARRTGGSAGTANDGAAYKLTAYYQNNSGTATLVGSVIQTVVGESQAGWNATLDTSGADVRVRVTGATNNNVTWHLNKFEVYRLGT